ncbi:MAG TPA: hypothetical protein VLB80_03135 [Candidatus Babeliales bacterium]|nr:hypothetical protein [Candidatus Babeliales bacterium]
MTKTSFFITVLMFMQTLCCMEISKYALPTIGNVINDMFAHQLTSNVGLFNHDNICALALVNKYLNTVVEKTALQRRQYLASQPAYINARTLDTLLYKQTTWHKYCSAYAYWVGHTTEDMRKWDKQILFTLVHLDGDNNIFTHLLEGSHTGSGALTPLFDSCVPFFNAKGDACFHAHGLFKKQQGTKDSILYNPYCNGYIFEYSIKTNGFQKRTLCYVNIISKETPDPDNKNIINCVKYLNDIRLKKIINSKVISESSTASCNLGSKIYDENGNFYLNNIKVYSINEADMNENIVSTK